MVDLHSTFLRRRAMGYRVHHFMNSGVLLPLAFSAFLWPSLATIIRAQTATATISGTVVDPSGAVVPGAELTLKSMSTNVERSVLTNGAGFYLFSNILPGQYRL